MGAGASRVGVLGRSGRCSRASDRLLARIVPRVVDDGEVHLEVVLDAVQVKRVGEDARAGQCRELARQTAQQRLTAGVSRARAAWANRAAGDVSLRVCLAAS